MNEHDINRADAITSAINEALRGNPGEVDISSWQSDELTQLAEYYNRLSREMKEIGEAAHSVSKGDLNRDIKSALPGAMALKNLKATLKHLTWQTQQVAKGDFTQRVDFLGDFSASFNSMVEQLESNRRAILENETQLQKQNQEMEQFLYMISHDLKTPLISIEGFASMLDEDLELDEDGSRIVKKIIHSAQKMRMMTDALVRLGRIGSVDTGKAMTSVREIVNGAVEYVRFAAETRGVEISTDLPDCSIYCYPTQARMLVENIVGNAVKYIGEENSDPRVEIRAVESDGAVEFCVRDNGVGIAPEAMKYIFEVFKRGPGAESQEGVGIGLAAVKKIIENHDGEIRVESAPGRGSSFYFTLGGSSDNSNA